MMSHVRKACDMAIHHLSWQATASALEDEDVIAQAMDWLTGGKQDIIIEGEKSHHGATIHRIYCKITKKSAAVKSIPRLGTNALEEILDSLESRLDEENVLHIRLALDQLTMAQVKIGDPKKQATIKCRIKLQVWPGENSVDVARKLILESIEIARSSGFPEPPESLD